MITSIPNKQRAIVFQGGGALGAYEAGAFKAIYNHIKEKEGTNSVERMFDIVAGTSIGAINASLLVDYVKKKNTWEGSVAMLEDFWVRMKNMTWVDNPFFEWWWNGLRVLAGSTQVALPETARRYWSWAQLACTPPFFGGGTSHLYFPHIDLVDTKFLNPFVFPHGLSYDYFPLKQFLRDRIEFPIKTEPGKPRLLVVSVDVKDCTTAVTFDSYASLAKKCAICDDKKDFDNNELLVRHMKEDHIEKLADEIKPVNLEYANSDKLWYSVYGEGENKNNRHVVFYDGIGLEQLTAGCMIPQSIDHPSLFDYISHENRTYWDGGLLSNTPLRELLQCHKDFWLNYYEEKSEGQNTVPELEVFIIDLFPAIELDKQIPSYGDIIQDRINDIRFHDRTVYDQKVAQLVSDYISLTSSLIDLCKRLIKRYDDSANTPISQVNLARKLLDTDEFPSGGNKSYVNKVLTDIINDKGLDKQGNGESIVSRILGQQASSYHRTGENRMYGNLLRGTFTVKVTRIERQDDPSTISGKIGDFSNTSITDLMTKGEQETKVYLRSEG
jgi:NTE family protein